MKPKFEPGNNIAIKVPPHQFEATVSFYRNILGLPQVDQPDNEQYERVAFNFGGKKLWIDKINALSQAEIWLEIKTDNIEQAADHLGKFNVTRRDEIETLPDNFNGFWIANPSNIIHLVSKQSSLFSQTTT